MNIREPGFIGGIANEIASDPRVAESSVGSIATKWAQLLQSDPGRLDETEVAVVEAAVTEAAYHEVAPNKLVAAEPNGEGFPAMAVQTVNPTDFLQGDLGVADQKAFLAGALMAVESAMHSRLAE